MEIECNLFEINVKWIDWSEIAYTLYDLIAIDLKKKIATIKEIWDVSDCNWHIRFVHF